MATKQATKQRIHNEWFMPVFYGGRKSCPTCKAKLGPEESIWTWGEYSRGYWFKIAVFCKACFAEEILSRLTQHAKGCGCTFELQARSGCTLPEWLKLY